MKLTETDRQGLQSLAFALAAPIIIPCFILGFIWQFIDFGWTMGNVYFNRFFD